MASELVTFKAADGVEIVGDYYPSGHGRFAIFLHMMPATKESWRAFAEKFVMTGYDCLAIDLRGHGESNMSGALNYRTFSDAEHQATIRDVEAAFDWLVAKGADAGNTVVVGASIGANLAINFLAERGFAAAIALSPGLDYHGVMTEPSVRALTSGQSVILVASDDDPESTESSRALHAANPSRTLLVERNGLGHGTRMFDRAPALMDELIALL